MALSSFTYQYDTTLRVVISRSQREFSYRDATQHGNIHVQRDSFLIGGTTEFLVAGVLPGVVKPMGRWSFTDTGVRLTRLTSISFGTYQPPFANTNDVSKATRSDLRVSLKSLHVLASVHLLFTS